LKEKHLSDNSVCRYPMQVEGVSRAADKLRNWVGCGPPSNLSGEGFLSVLTRYYVHVCWAANLHYEYCCLLPCINTGWM